MDITIQHHLNTVKNIKNKNHWKVRQSKKFLDEHISGLRLVALKMRGTSVSKWCNRESNYIEKQLLHAMLT